METFMLFNEDLCGGADDLNMAQAYKGRHVTAVIMLVSL